MNWATLKDKIYFVDGSLRDIIVEETTRKEWSNWIDYVNSNYVVEFYNGQKNQIENSIDKNIVFKLWDELTDYSNNATIRIDDIEIKCYFFIESEIENDITPKDINSLEDHNKLISYMKGVSNFLGKRIILTPENYSRQESEYIIIENGEIKIDLG